MSELEEIEAINAANAKYHADPEIDELEAINAAGREYRREARAADNEPVREKHSSFFNAAASALFCVIIAVTMIVMAYDHLIDTRVAWSVCMMVVAYVSYKVGRYVG